MADGTLIFDTKLDSEGLSTGLSKIGNIAGTALKGTAVAIGAAATGIGVLAKNSLDAYANYEQLVGGVETLFDTSASKVTEYADMAYKTAGLSANQYMETVTSFSASLLQGLDGDTSKAADVANQAIIDMSDNANKMGTDMSAIQNAYQGFAKQNYTMLDNLKLGYGGTKQEMERLLEDAEKIQKEKFGVDIDYDIENFSDIINAIHDVQSEMGITGTTAKEASTTIQGSLGQMKSAWDNLVAGLGNEDADLGALIDNFMESVKTVGENIIPEVEKILTGVGELVAQMLPEVMQMIPELITNVLPDLIQCGADLVNTLCTALVDNAPALIDGAITLVMTLVDCLLQNLPQLIQCGLEAIVQLAMGIAEALPTLIPTIVETVLTIVEYLIDNVDMLIDAAIAIITALAEGLINALPVLIEKAPEIIVKLLTALIEAIPKLLEAAVKIIEMLAKGLIENVPKLIAKVPEIITKLKNAFLNLVSGFADIGKNIIDGIWNGISAGWEWLTGKVSDLAHGLLDAAKSALGIASPSKKFRYLGEMCVAGFDDGIDELMDGGKLASNINASLGTLSANIQGGAIASGNGVNGGFTQVINVNREISTPDQLARAVRLESRYGLMKGVSFA